jgi:hypothetical protein
MIGILSDAHGKIVAFRYAMTLVKDLVVNQIY